MKQSQLEKAIANLQEKRDAIDLALRHLEAERDQKPKPARKQRPVAADKGSA